MRNKLNIAILGTGNIGTDLFFKVVKSKFLNCVLFSGRNENSPSLGMAYLCAKEKIKLSKSDYYNKI